MIRLLLLSFLLAVIGQNGTWGKPVHGDIRSILQVDFSDVADPANDFQAKRNSYHSARGPEVLNPSDPSSLCYLIQESDTESQISCRLRFTRSKFNFNPFGLRFGKRQGGVLDADTGKLGPQSSSSKMLQSLLKPKLDRMIELCGEMWGEDC
uniref:Kisspeptin 2 n=1 Tax=Podarcis muralis TaxID=64176 RepID=A0A670KLU7_PODMU